MNFIKNLIFYPNNMSSANITLLDSLPFELVEEDVQNKNMSKGERMVQMTFSLKIDDYFYLIYVKTCFDIHNIYIFF